MSRAARFPKPQSQDWIAAWPGDEDVKLRAMGEHVVVPGRNTVATVGRGKPYKFPSATDAAGRPIPGTILLKTLTRRDNDGNTIVVFDADAFVDLLGEIHSTHPNDGVFGAGLVIVRTAEEAQQEQAEGRGLWLEAKRRWALETIQSLRAFREKWLAKNGSAAPRTDLDDDAERAAKILAELGKDEAKVPTLSDEQLQEILGGNFAATAKPAEPVKSSQAAPAIALSDVIALGAEAYREALGLGLNVKKALLEGVLRGDEAAVGELMEMVQQSKQTAQSA
jgi:hypothetical protein